MIIELAGFSTAIVLPSAALPASDHSPGRHHATAPHFWRRSSTSRIRVQLIEEQIIK